MKLECNNYVTRVMIVKELNADPNGDCSDAFPLLFVLAHTMVGHCMRHA